MALTRLAPALFLTVHIATTGAPTSDEVKCSYSRKFACTSTECQAVEIGSSYLLVPSIPTLRDAMIYRREIEVRRCDSQGCTPVSVSASASGIFINLVSRVGGFSMKLVGSDDIGKQGDFIEVATLFLDAYVGYGHCAQD